MRKGIKTLVEEIERHGGHKSNSATFAPVMEHEKTALSVWLAEEHRRWWETWIAPKLEEIKAKAERKGRKARAAN